MCGIVGIIGTPDASREAFLGLTTLQHRGQDAAGILTYDRDGFHQVKNLGLVDSVFDQKNIERLNGEIAVGHARYSTVGKGDLIDVQPLLLSYPYGLGMVHNGNIVNYASLAVDLKHQMRRNILSHSDTEVMLNLLAAGLAEATEESGTGTKDVLPFEDICKALNSVFLKVNGSYSVVTLIADQGLLAFRDPYGIRPIAFGKKKVNGKVSYMVASESAALRFNGYGDLEDLKPGEVLFIDLKGEVHRKVLHPNPSRNCMFEWVYFASAESELDGVPVYRARINLGRKLGEVVKKVLSERGLEADLVAPVPDTSRTAAIALAEELGLPYREALIKNRYIKRTFILSTQDRRDKAVNLKLSPVHSEIQGKNLILVDDSIVRGTTSKKIIELVKSAGAAKVFFVSTCPPIRYPCFYGIDFPNGEELVAYNREVKEIEKELGADALIYLGEEGLKGAIEHANPCMACLDSKYPTDVSSAGQEFGQSRLEDRKQIGSTS